MGETQMSWPAGSLSADEAIYKGLQPGSAASLTDSSSLHTTIHREQQIAEGAISIIQRCHRIRLSYRSPTHQAPWASVNS